MLEVIDDPNDKDTGKVFESQKSRWQLPHVPKLTSVPTTIPSLCALPTSASGLQADSKQ